MRDLREINCETNEALRAIEARQSMRHIEYGFAVGAWKLDLSRINAVGRGSPLLLGLGLGLGLVGPHQLGRQHLRQLARRADKLGQAGHHGEHHLATGAPHLAPSGRPGAHLSRLRERRRRRRGNWRRRQRRLPHWEDSATAKLWIGGGRRGLSDEWSGKN